ncbi:MAG: vWA domain-containing protein [Planctomycetota bacterium]
MSAGAGVTAVATVEGLPGARVRVRLLVDGKPLQETEVGLGVSGRAGVRFDVPARRSGRHVVTVAALPPPGDPCAANDRRSAGLVAIGARRAAVLNAQGLSKELSAGGWEVVDGLHADLADLDLLIVRDSPITAFEDHGEAVRRFVEGGGGLLVAGGTSCFGPGGWGGTPLEACLPVLSHPDGEGLFVAVLLDRSGTMADPFRPGGGAKFDAARRATEALVAVLPEGADLLVVPFAEAVLGEPRALPIADAASRAAARTRLEDAGRPSGGTMLAGPLLFTREALREVEAEKRLVLLFTDGRREGESASAVGEAAAALRNTGARVVCFAVGEDADRALLDELGGPGAAAVPVTEAGQVRDGFLRALFELQGKDRILRGEREVRATGAGGLPVVEPAPATDIVRTWAREGATIWHVTDEDAPVTAGRRYGLGRAVVSTADLAAMPGALTGALVEAAARPASLSAARFFVSADGRRLTAALDLDAPSASGFLVDAAGTRVPISFTATGPGTFEAAMPAAAPGAAWIDLAAPDGRVVRAGLSVPWPAEFRASGPDSVALEELSRRFGGGGVDGGDGSRDASPFLAGLALLLFLADRLKRGRPPVR